MDRPATKQDADRRWRVGIVGLGKLGMPVALAMSLKGHYVMGYDVNHARMQKDKFAEREVGPNGEPSIEPLLQQSDIRFGTLDEVVEHSEIIFVAVQTPHDPRYEGVSRLPAERVDFDYSYLKAATKDLSAAIDRRGWAKCVVVISTVLPGTMREQIIPHLSPLVKLCYNPFFIAMGTTVQDFLNPEFVLFGVADPEAAKWAKQFYRSLHDKPFAEMSIESAELAKVSYNTIITSKICIANTIMEIAHKTPGANVDDVNRALKLATDRIVSPRYMDAGMGDGGGCHPRDNIALSWLAKKLNISHDWYEQLMLCRERQTEFLADLCSPYRAKFGAHVTVLGKSFKPETNLTVGSPATLLVNLLAEREWSVYNTDPVVDGEGGKDEYPSRGLYVIATKHAAFRRTRFCEGSVVIDPFRYIRDQPGVEVIRVGIGK